MYRGRLINLINSGSKLYNCSHLLASLWILHLNNVDTYCGRISPAENICKQRGWVWSLAAEAWSFLGEDHGVHQMFFFVNAANGKVGCPLVATSCEQPYVTILWIRSAKFNQNCHKLSLLGHLTCNKYQQVHVRNLTFCCYTCNYLKTIMPKRFLERVLQVFLQSFLYQKCCDMSKHFSLQGHLHGESLTFRRDISSLRIPENMCVHVFKKCRVHVTSNIYFIWYIHLSMYFFCLFIQCIMLDEHIVSLGLFLYSLICDSISGFNHVWAMSLFYLLMWCVSKFVPPNSRQVSDPTNYHKNPPMPTALSIVLYLQTNHFSPWKLRENPFPTYKQHLLFCPGSHLSVLQGLPEALTPGTTAVRFVSAPAPRQHKNDLSLHGKVVFGQCWWSILMAMFNICLINQIKYIYISNKIMNLMVNLDGQFGSLSLFFQFFCRLKPPKRNSCSFY